MIDFLFVQFIRLFPSPLSNVTRFSGSLETDVAPIVYEEPAKLSVCRLTTHRRRHPAGPTTPERCPRPAQRGPGHFRAGRLPVDVDPREWHSPEPDLIFGFQSSRGNLDPAPL